MHVYIIPYYIIDLYIYRSIQYTELFQSILPMVRRRFFDNWILGNRAACQLWNKCGNCSWLWVVRKWHIRFVDAVKRNEASLWETISDKFIKSSDLSPQITDDS